MICVLTGEYDLPEDKPGGPKKSNQSWCGRTISSFEFSFIDASHAALNGKKKGRLVLCPDCRSAIIIALLQWYD